MNVKSNLMLAAVAAALIPIVIFASGATIYFNNLPEYSFTCRQFITMMGIVALGIFIGIFGFLACFVKAKWFRWVFLTFFAIGLCMWVQGNFIFYPRGLAGDVARTFGEFPVYGVWEFFIYALVFGAVFYFRDFVQKYCRRLVFIVVATQLIMTLPAILSYNPILLKRNYKIGWPIQNSKEENITIILVDSTGTDFFDKMREAFPEFNHKFKDFEYFHSLLSLYPQTLYAVPTLLSGSNYFDENMKWNPNTTVWNQETRGFTCGVGGLKYINNINKMHQDTNALLSRLPQKGFTMELYGNMKYVPIDYKFINLDYTNDTNEKNRLITGYILNERFIPFSLYRTVPLLIKETVIRRSEIILWKLYFLLKLQKRNETPYYVVNKIKTSNLQLVYGDEKILNIPDVIKQDTTKRFRFIHLTGCHVFDDYPEETHLPYGKLLFDGLSNYLDYLKKNDCYDNSWIIIMGDHGQHTGKVQYRFNPIFLIKRPHAQNETLQINENIILMRDIAPTLLGELGIQTTKPFSIWNQTDEQKKERQKLWNEYFVKNAQ